MQHEEKNPPNTDLKLSNWTIGLKYLEKGSFQEFHLKIFDYKIL